jgi:hypothetical protein
VPDLKDEILISYSKDRYVVDIATGDDVKAHVYSVDDLKAYDLVFVSESVSSSDTKDLKSGLIFENCEMLQFSKKSLLSRAKKHPDFQVTLCHYFVSTDVNFAYIESE